MINKSKNITFGVVYLAQSAPLYKQSAPVPNQSALVQNQSAPVQNQSAPVPTIVNYTYLCISL